MTLEKKVVAALAQLQKQHGKLRPHLPAMIGVSGGRDSVALLHVLTTLGWKRLIVCHMNHGLRGRASGQDAAFVRRFAKKLGLRCHVATRDIARDAELSKESIETAARNKRTEFLLQVMAEEKATFVFLGHHADDQAETILANLCRGSGLSGMSGMDLSSVTDSGLIKLRPMLQVTRAEVDEYVAAHALKFRDDESNASLEHRRNRLRHQAIPLLKEIFQRDVSELVVRAGILSARDENCLQQMAQTYLTAGGVIHQDGSLIVTTALVELHPAVLSRVLQLWLSRQGVGGLGARELDSAMQLVINQKISKINLPRDRWLRRKAKRLFVDQAI